MQLETIMVGFRNTQKLLNKQGFMVTVDDFFTWKLLDLGDPLFGLTGHPVYQWLRWLKHGWHYQDM